MTPFLRERLIPLGKREKFYSIIGIGLFFSLFLIFFQPFGVNNYDPTETITPGFIFIMLCMGIFTVLVLLLNEYIVFPLFFKGEIVRWQMLIWLVWSNIYVASCLFLFYNVLGEWHDFVFGSWLEFIGNFTALSIIPLTAIYFYARTNQLKALTQTTADFSSERANIITIPSDSNSDHTSFSLDSILLIESEDNYVAIHHTHNGNLAKTLVRTTLKKLDERAIHPALVRCHRSFMVNLIHFSKYEGNKQQGFITLLSVPTPIPVSRSYAADLLAKLS